MARPGRVRRRGSRRDSADREIRKRLFSARLNIAKADWQITLRSFLRGSNPHSREQAERFENSFNLLLRSRLRSHNGKAPDRFEQSHPRHSELHRPGAGFDEIDLHQGLIFSLQLTGALEITLHRGTHKL